MSLDERLRQELQEVQSSGFGDIYGMQQFINRTRRYHMAPVISTPNGYGTNNSWFINGIFTINGINYLWLVGYNSLPLNSYCLEAGVGRLQLSLDVGQLSDWHLNNVARVDDIRAQIRHPDDVDILTNSAGPNRGRIRHRDVSRPRNRHWRLFTEPDLVNNIKLGITWRAIGYGALVPVFRVENGIWCIQLSARGINA